MTKKQKKTVDLTAPMIAEISKIADIEERTFSATIRFLLKKGCRQYDLEMRKFESEQGKLFNKKEAGGFVSL